MILLAIRPFFGPFYCVPLCLVPLLHDRNPFPYSMWSIELLKHMCRLSFFLLGVSLFFSCYEKRSYLTYQEIFFFSRSFAKFFTLRAIFFGRSSRGPIQREHNVPPFEGPGHGPPYK